MAQDCQVQVNITVNYMKITIMMIINYCYYYYYYYDYDHGNWVIFVAMGLSESQIKASDFTNSCNGPFADVVQNLQTGEQMTHWDMLNKATKSECS